jgi:hypothetical protein
VKNNTPNTFFALAACLCMTLFVGCSGPPLSPAEQEAQNSASSGSSAETSDGNATFRTRWDQVAQTFRDTGNFVEAYDDTAPWTMRVQLRMEVPAHDARKLAVTAREGMGDKAIVYIYDDTRKQLAKASSWGTE